MPEEHREGCMCTPFNLWSSSRHGRIVPKESDNFTLWIGGWVGPRACLDVVENWKSSRPCRKLDHNISVHYRLVIRQQEDMPRTPPSTPPTEISCLVWHGHHVICRKYWGVLWRHITKMFMNLIFMVRASCLTLILPRSHTGTVWFYTSTSNKRASRPKLYTKSLTRDLKLMYSRFTLVRISINL